MAASATLSEDMAALRASKKAMRQKINETISKLPRHSVDEQTHRAVDVLLGTNEYKTAKRISVYLSIAGREIQTRRIVEDALKTGKNVFVPFIYKQDPASVRHGPTSIMDMLQLKSQEDYDSLKLDKWGIPTLSSDTLTERENCLGGEGLSQDPHPERGQGNGLNLVVMPGMAFDRQLGRLGHGRGYYDNFLSRCKEQIESSRTNTAMPLTIALALDEQILAEGESVPMSEYDWRVGAVVTGSGRILSS